MLQFNFIKKPKGNDRSPECQQAQSLDKVVVFCFLPYMGMMATWSCFRSMAAIVSIGSLVL